MMPNPGERELLNETMSNVCAAQWTRYNDHSPEGDPDVVQCDSGTVRLVLVHCGKCHWPQL